MTGLNSNSIRAVRPPTLYKVGGSFVFASSWLGRKVCQLFGAEVALTTIQKVNNVERKLERVIREAASSPEKRAVLLDLLKPPASLSTRPNVVMHQAQQVADGRFLQNDSRRTSARFRAVMTLFMQNVGDATPEEKRRMSAILKEFDDWEGESEAREVALEKPKKGPNERARLHLMRQGTCIDDRVFSEHGTSNAWAELQQAVRRKMNKTFGVPSEQIDQTVLDGFLDGASTDALANEDSFKYLRLRLFDSSIRGLSGDTVSQLQTSLQDARSSAVQECEIDGKKSLILEQRSVFIGGEGHKEDYYIATQRSIVTYEKGRWHQKTTVQWEKKNRVDYLLEELKEAKKGGAAEKQAEDSIVQQELFPLLVKKREEGFPDVEHTEEASRFRHGAALIHRHSEEVQLALLECDRALQHDFSSERALEGEEMPSSLAQITQQEVEAAIKGLIPEGADDAKEDRKLAFKRLLGAASDPSFDRYSIVHMSEREGLLGGLVIPLPESTLRETETLPVTMTKEGDSLVLLQKRRYTRKREDGQIEWYVEERRTVLRKEKGKWKTENRISFQKEDEPIHSIM